MNFEGIEFAPLGGGGGGGVLGEFCLGKDA